ncbi:MAG: hypothetical protein ACTSYL_08550 [Candidatus Thorarchaeota archaeon]
MSRNRSLVIALTDIHRAFQVNLVKYGLIGVGMMGPLFAVAMIAGTSLTLNPASSDYAIFLSVMMPFASAMLALMSVIPASLIAANSFVGEKEQRTLEPLLLTPLTDQQIIIGKVLSAFIPCVILIYGGTLLTSIAISVILLLAGRPLIMFPDLPGMFLIFVVGPIVVLGTVATMILVSSRVSRVYEAYQTGSVTSLILLIPFFLPLLGISNNFIQIEYVWMADILTLVVAIIIAAITWILALKQFNRDRMISMI